MPIHMKLQDALDRDDLPADCITDCSGPGDASAAVKHWCRELQFTVDPEGARRALLDYGAWDADELAAKDADELAAIALWLACGDFAEGDDLFILGT